jgi:hypothetical protein
MKGFEPAFFFFQCPSVYQIAALEPIKCEVCMYVSAGMTTLNLSFSTLKILARDFQKVVVKTGHT